MFRTAHSPHIGGMGGTHLVFDQTRLGMDEFECGVGYEGMEGRGVACGKAYLASTLDVSALQTLRLPKNSGGLVAKRVMRQWTSHTVAGLSAVGREKEGADDALRALGVGAGRVVGGEVDPVEGLIGFASGFHSIVPLSDAQIELVGDVVLAGIVAVGTEPEFVLESLGSLSRSWILYRIRAGLGLPDPVPGSRVLAAALAREDVPGWAHVLPTLPPGSPGVVLDFGLGSEHVSGEDVADPGLFCQAVNSVMDGAGVELGLGRYLEIRSIYATQAYAPVAALLGPAFASRMREGAVMDLPRRDMHLGVDLFAAAGTPVAAALPGKVHSFANNKSYQDYGPTVVVEHHTASLFPHLLGSGAGVPDVFYTLYGHLSVQSLEGLQVGMPVAGGGVIGWLGDVDVNGGWPPHLHFQIVLDMCGQRGDFEGVAAANHRALYASLTPDPNLLLRYPELFENDSVEPTTGEESDEVKAALVARRKQVMGGNLSYVGAPEGLHIVRGRGQYLFSREGVKYLDCVNNVCHVGHCHPSVVAAGATQMVELNTNTRYLHEGVLDYADALLATFPDELEVVFFVNSGSEANDLALRLALAATGGGEATLVLDHAYHGHVTSMIDRSPYKFNGRGGNGGVDHVFVVPNPDPYRHPENGDGAAAVGAVVERVESRGLSVNALFAESVLGCGGQVVLPEGYLAGAFEATRAAGGVCVVDEVQVGFGRVGTHFWGFQTQGVVPDIVTLGKPMGNGHPMGAVVTTRAVAEAFNNGMEFFSTFGGNPVSMAIGAEVLKVIERDGLMENAVARGEQLVSGFRDLAESYPCIGDVRGLGLFVGCEFVVDGEGKAPDAGLADEVVAWLREEWQVLVSTDGPGHNVLKLKPPMCLGAEDVDRVLAGVRDALERHYGTLGR